MLVWFGVLLTLAGLAGLVWCIRQALVIRRMKADPDAQRQALARLLPVNLGSLLLSALGLMAVVTGILLG